MQNTRKKLPVVITVPHAGVGVPPEVEGLVTLTARDIKMDGDDGAAEVFDLEDEVEALLTTKIARCFVDLDRPEDERGEDGAVKKVTCYGTPIYREPLPESVIETLLARYYRPFHDALTRIAASGRVKLGVDCHTMAEWGPPIGPDPRLERPPICLGNDGTCPDHLFTTLRECLEHAFSEFYVAHNLPYTGEHIACRHAEQIPWVQLEISRVPFLSNAEKRERVLQALTDWAIDVA